MIRNLSLCRRTLHDEVETVKHATMVDWKSEEAVSIMGVVSELYIYEVYMRCTCAKTPITIKYYQFIY